MYVCMYVCMYLCMYVCNDIDNINVTLKETKFLVIPWCNIATFSMLFIVVVHLQTSNSLS